MMGLFSGMRTSAEKGFPQTEPEAVLGVLLSTIAADGEVSETEKDSFLYLANHTRALGPMSAHEFQSHVETARGILRRDGAAALMARCAPRITAGLKEPLFVNCCDLIMRDGRVEQEEEQLIEALQERLSIDDELARATVGIILTKYSL